MIVDKLANKMCTVLVSEVLSLQRDAAPEGSTGQEKEQSRSPAESSVPERVHQVLSAVSKRFPSLLCYSHSLSNHSVR